MEANLFSDSLVTVKDAARALGISIVTIHRYEKQSLISSMRTAGGHRRYSSRDLENFRISMKSGRFIPKRGRPSKEQQGQVG
jgi:putative resolvase